MANKAGRYAAGEEKSHHAELLDVWKKGQQLHNWIVSSKMAFTQQHEAKLNEGKGKQKMSEEELADAKKKETYEGYCEQILDKCEFLLSARPCISSSTPQSDLSDVSLPSVRCYSLVGCPQVSELKLTRAHSLIPGGEVRGSGTGLAT